MLFPAQVTSGTTWHAAGLVGATRNTASETKLSMVGTQLYTQLLDETGFDPGYKNSGSVNVARTAERMEVGYPCGVRLWCAPVVCACGVSSVVYTDCAARPALVRRGASTHAP